MHLEYFLEYSVQLGRIREQSNTHITGTELSGTQLSPHCAAAARPVATIPLHNKHCSELGTLSLQDYTIAQSPASFFRAQKNNSTSYEVHTLKQLTVRVV